MTERQEELFSGNVYFDSGHSLFFFACTLPQLNKYALYACVRHKKKTSIETQRVIIAIGYQSDNRLYDQIKSFGYEIHRIGDCLEARNAKEAIYEGMVLGCSI